MQAQKKNRTGAELGMTQNLVGTALILSYCSSTTRNPTAVLIVSQSLSLSLAWLVSLNSEPVKKHFHIEFLPDVELLHPKFALQYISDYVAEGDRNALEYSDEGFMS